jgi:hypothetical protein
LADGEAHVKTPWRLSFKQSESLYNCAIIAHFGASLGVYDSATGRKREWFAVNEQQARTLVMAYVEGWKHNNPETVLETLTPDCLIIESHGPTYSGRDHVRQWITTWFQDGGRIQRWDITSFLWAGDMAAFEWTFECSGSWGTAAFDGATIIRFSGDLIAYLREYRCTTAPYPWSGKNKQRGSMSKEALEKRIVETRYKLNISANDLSWISSPEFVAFLDAWSDLYRYYMKHDGDTKYLYFEVVAIYLEITRFLNILLRDPKHSASADLIEESLGSLEYTMDGLTQEGYRQINNPGDVRKKDYGE